MSNAFFFASTKVSEKINDIRSMNNIKFSSSKMKNTNYWFLLIFKNFITLFRRFCQSRFRAYFEVFSINNQKNFCWAKHILPHFFLGKCILRSSQSETFNKGHKINTGVFYTKKANFFPINVLYKKFQDFQLKNK